MEARLVENRVKVLEKEEERMMKIQKMEDYMVII